MSIFDDIETPTHQHNEDWHTPMAPPPNITRIHAAENAAVTKVGNLLNSKAKNWSGWSQAMTLLFKLFSVQDYVLGKVACPNIVDDTMSADNWAYNDTFAQILINVNITDSEQIHTNGCMSAHHMWTNLQSMHESKSHLILMTHLRMLMNTIARDEDNIPEHLTKLKHCWDQLSLFGDTNYKVSEFLFKRIIASSLPESWDQFTDQYVAGQLDFVDTDPRKHIDTQQFLGILKQEYERRQSRKSGATKFSKQALFSQNGRHDNVRPSLASCINGNTYNQGLSSGIYCKICERTNHTAVDCHHKGKPKCGQCGKFSHTSNKCWHASGADRGQREKRGRGVNPYPNRRPRREAHNADTPAQANDMEVEEHIAFIADVGGVDSINTVYDDKYECYNLDSDEIEEHLIYYDWVADTGATSHITNRRDTFTTYKRIPDVPIAGVGELKARVIGRGTVNIQSKYNGKIYILKLLDVLHVPENRNNLLSLGHWETDG